MSAIPGRARPQERSTEALSTCRRVLAQHSKSFNLAARLLPAGCREDAAVVYAFCRRADDAVDLVSDSGQARRAVDQLNAELNRLLGGGSEDDLILAAFQEVVFRRQIPAAYPRELIVGLWMDANGFQPETLDSLLLYCFRVAGTVGLMMTHVMGVSDVRALKHACHLGIGMQLTNICRDVLEDWERGRLYIPDELLARVGLANLRAQLGSPLSPSARSRLSLAIAELLGLADGYYVSGDTGLRALGWRCALAVRTARLVYAQIGAVLARTGHDIFGGRAVVSTSRKLLLLGRALWAGLAEAPRRIWKNEPRLPILQPVKSDDLLRL